jgi:hypothetical protein
MIEFTRSFGPVPATEVEHGASSGRVCAHGAPPGNGLGSRVRRISGEISPAGELSRRLVVPALDRFRSS